MPGGRQCIVVHRSTSRRIPLKDFPQYMHGYYNVSLVDVMPVANPITKREGARKQTTKEENQSKGGRAHQIMAGFRWRAEASDASNSCLTHPLNTGPWFAETDNLVWSGLVLYNFFILNILAFCTKIQHGHTVAYSLVILYEYVFVHGFVWLTHDGFFHILTKLCCFVSSFTLSLVFKSVFA